MTKLLLVPALLLAACIDDLRPEEDQVTGNAEGDTAGSGLQGPTAVEKTLWAGFVQEPLDCVDHSLRLIGHWGYSDGTRPTNVSCLFTLPDGTVLSDFCFVSPSLEVGAVVTFTLTDLDTGAVATYSEFAQGPASFETTVDVSTDGLTLSWDAHTAYGNIVDDGRVRVTISPSENVILGDPSVLEQYAGTVSVTEPGTYTVAVRGFMQFPDVGGCSADAEATVEVACDLPEFD
jgi:hypothetical protein